MILIERNWVFRNSAESQNFLFIPLLSMRSYFLSSFSSFLSIDVTNIVLLSKLVNKEIRNAIQLEFIHIRISLNFSLSLLTLLVGIRCSQTLSAWLGLPIIFFCICEEIAICFQLRCEIFTEVPVIEIISQRGIISAKNSGPNGNFKSLKVNWTCNLRNSRNFDTASFH